MRKSTIILSVLLTGSVLYGGIETATAYKNLDIINNQHVQYEILKAENEDLNSVTKSLRDKNDELEKKISDANTQTFLAKKAQENANAQRPIIVNSDEVQAMQDQTDAINQQTQAIQDNTQAVQDATK
ncbi:hypothetical protein [Neobacillus ginsengisoli]|nr:hypothetical protein [Neobacillus ginsengisoli]